MTIKRSEDILFDDTRNINVKALQSCLDEHKQTILRLDKLKNYYDGEHEILNRKKDLEDLANNKLVVNLAEYITDFSTAYFMGNELKYVFPNAENRTDDDFLLEAFAKANINQVDTEVARDLSIFGIGIEHIYQNEDGITKSTNLDPRTAFVVVDDTVEETDLLGVRRITKRDEDNNFVGETIEVFSDDNVFIYEYVDAELKLKNKTSNIFREVPMIEYWNKVNRKGDFESTIPLIDAYNILQSDRVNDKEQFVDSLLVLYGTLAGDNEEEKVQTAKSLKKMGLLELAEGDRAEYLSKTFHESDVELLRKSIVSDIHKISKVPNLTDENFAGNSSGVAMRYKLLGLEQLAQTKEGYYRIGLKKRIRLYANILNIKNINVDVDKIDITFTRSLPANETEISELINNLKGTVSDETLISQLPFISDVKVELEKIKKQKESNLSFIGNAFGSYDGEKVEDEN